MMIDREVFEGMNVRELFKCRQLISEVIEDRRGSFLEKLTVGSVLKTKRVPNGYAVVKEDRQLDGMVDIDEFICDGLNNLRLFATRNLLLGEYVQINYDIVDGVLVDMYKYREEIVDHDYRLGKIVEEALENGKTEV